jgi:MFS superfamily sulfate permease-like transporter
MIKKDIIAGFSVFLLALPLCLGIAIASGFPPVSGIFTAIIGGFLGFLSGGSNVTIKGPAAGMIVIALSAVQELGQGDPLLGYKLTLAVAVVAALFQMLIALMRKAVIAEIMPPSVIHGMLAAIGVIIISKQVYVLEGITPAPAKPLELLYRLPSEIAQLHPILFGIGLFAFCIVVLWPKLTKFSYIPSSMVILAAVIPLSLYFEIAPDYLIQLPANFFDGIQFPDFSQLMSYTSLKYILLFVLVGSIESLLTVCAVDTLRKDAPPSDLNRDLLGLGAANLVSAFVGGLPMISEIVRSKANIDYGAVSAKANFFHGFFMLLAVILFPKVMNLIPLSALAALLIYVGLRLASPAEFVHAYKIGKDQFILFLTTFIVTLETDLLIGVATGFCLKLILLVLRGNRLFSLFFPTFALEKADDHIKLLIDGPLTFVGYLKFKNMLDKLTKEHKKIVVSLHAVTYLDHTVMKKIQLLSQIYKGVEISIDENQQLVRLYNHPLSARQV